MKAFHAIAVSALIVIAVAGLLLLRAFSLPRDPASTPSLSATDAPGPPVADSLSVAEFGQGAVLPADTGMAPDRPGLSRHPAGNQHPPHGFATAAAALDFLGENLFTNPAKTLQVSREAHTRHASTDDGPRFNLYVIRSLVELGRFDEAVAETDSMLARYPGHSLAEAARRHLKAQPLGAPPRAR